MDLTPGYAAAAKRSNSDPSTAVYAESKADYLQSQLNLKSHWPGNMYPSQQIAQHSSSKPQLIRAGLDENKKNYAFGSPYTTKQNLNAGSVTASQPKKESIWQTVFRSASNLLGEHLGSTGSLIKNWSNMNNPLSVTVVAPNFYETLQRSQDQKLVSPTSAFYTQRKWSQESVCSDENAPTVLYEDEILSGKKFSISDTTDSDKMWKEYKCMYGAVQDSCKDKEIVNSVDIVNSCGCNSEDLRSFKNIVIDDEQVIDKSTNFANTLKVDDEPVMLEKPDILEHTQPQECQSQSPTASSSEYKGVTGMLSNAYNKVVNGMVDLLQPGPSNSEPELSTLFTKRACSPKPRPKKVHNISSGRGRGRGKSQLRRSGVSQKRHRKERSRYDTSEDIKSDIDNWEELEFSPYTNEDQDVCDFAAHSSNDDCDSTAQPLNDDFDQVDGVCVKRPISYTLGDIEPKKRKPNKKEKRAASSSWTQVSVARKPTLDNDEDVDFDLKGFRGRLLSDSSVDSEDGYCIVFQKDDCSDRDADSESESESEEESSMETETESDSESDDEAGIRCKRNVKVRFNLKPEVHMMIAWKFAYKSARRGNWEQVRRDQERFQRRVNSYAAVLDPILSEQHRMRVWHDRFEE